MNKFKLLGLNFDEYTGHWTAEIYKPIEGKGKDEIAIQDYEILKADLGKGTRDADMKIFEVSNKKISSRIWKEDKDKREMKEALRRMVDYIYAIQNLGPMPLSKLLATLELKSPANQKFIDQIQRNMMVEKTFGDWIDY